MVKGFGVFADELRASGGIHNHSGNAKHGDYAYFPGTGPAGKTCNDCYSMIHSRGAKHFGRCLGAANIRRVQLGDVGYIDRGAASCRAFQERPENVKPWDRYREIFRGYEVQAEEKKQAYEAKVAESRDGD